MLTVEMLNAQQGLAGLTDEQKQTIATLSQNDENTVIGTRIGEIYREMDSTIKEATGIERDGAEKTYVYLKRATTAFADKFKDYDTLKGQITTLTAEKASLEEKIRNGAADQELKTQLENVRKELQTTKDQFNTLKASADKAKLDHEAALLGLRIDAEMSRAKEGLKFKAGLNQAALDMLVGQAVAKVKGYSPKFEGEAGKEILRFYDANGVIMNNPENKLNPYTAQELLVKELGALDILDKGKTAGAGGTGNPPTGGSTITASTQVEAMEAISKDLIARGFVKGTSKYEAEVKKMWEENKISSLPLQ